MERENQLLTHPYVQQQRGHFRAGTQRNQKSRKREGYSNSQPVFDSRRVGCEGKQCNCAPQNRRRDVHSRDTWRYPNPRTEWEAISWCPSPYPPYRTTCAHTLRAVFGVRELGTFRHGQSSYRSRGNLHSGHPKLLMAFNSNR